MAQKEARHGLYALSRRVSASGLRQVDGRSTAMRAVTTWRGQLLRDLGGDVSAQKLTLVDLATKTMLYLNHIDSFLLQQGSLINKRKRTLLPIVRERQAMADSLARLLGQLGLERVPKDAGTIPSEWIERVKPTVVEDEPEPALSRGEL